MGNRIALVGLGGIGCSILPLLTRFALSKNKTLVLIDGDQYEEKNLNRQVFPPSFVGMNKAAAQKAKLNVVMPWLVVYTHAEFITMDNAEDLLSNCSHIITGVDNHRARYVVSKYFQRYLSETRATKEGHWLITAGNTQWDGNAHIYGRRMDIDGEEVYYGEPPEVRHTEIATTMNGSREGVSCQDLANLEGGEQTMLANTFAAMMAFNLLQATVSYPGALNGIVDTYFDCKQHAFNVIRANPNKELQLDLELEDNDDENIDGNNNPGEPAPGN